MPSGQLDFIPAVGTADFSPEQVQWLTLANRLGRERFAPRAATWDREASFPFANYDDLREAGLLALCVPRAFGGAGADFATYCMVGAEIGRCGDEVARRSRERGCRGAFGGRRQDGALGVEDDCSGDLRRELHQLTERLGRVHARRR